MLLSEDKKDTPWFEERRTERGPTILLIHGLMETHDSWKSVESELAGIGNLLVVDLPGHGNSASLTGAWSIDRTVETIAQLIILKGYRNICVVGFSFGGRIAYLMAARFPALVACLAVVDIGFLPKKEAHTKFLSRKWSGNSQLNYAMIERYIAEISRTNYSDALRAIDIPVILLRAENSNELSSLEALDMIGLLNNGRLKTIIGCHHAVHKEKPALFLSEILPFIKLCN